MIRAIGVSNFSASQVREAREHLSRADIASDQVKYNLLERGPERELLPYLKREGLSLIAYSPLAQGALTGRYDGTVKPAGYVRRFNSLFSSHNLRRLQPLIATLNSIGRVGGKTVAQVALNWLLHHPSVVPIPGAKGPSNVEDDSGAADWRLTKEELERVEEAYNAFNR